MKTRKLTDFEIKEAKIVYQDNIDYSLVLLHFEGFWSFGGYGRVLGNSIYFPGEARTSKSYFPWLIHELCHVYQYQHFGWKYIPLALFAQVSKGYDYGGEEGLKKAIKKGKQFKDFNYEQQGDIMRDYYIRYKMGKALYPWDYYVKQL